MWRQELDMNIAQFLGNNMAGGIVNRENDPSLLFFNKFNKSTKTAVVIHAFLLCFHVTGRLSGVTLFCLKARGLAASPIRWVVLTSPSSTAAQHDAQSLFSELATFAWFPFENHWLTFTPSPFCMRSRTSLLCCKLSSVCNFRLAIFSLMQAFHNVLYNH